MMSVDEVVLILGMFAVTFGVRYASLALVGKTQLPENLLRALRYVPVAVLTAITVPEMFIRDGSLTVSYTNPYLVGGIVAIAISWYTRNLLITIAGGLAVFFAYRWLLGL